jgi:hypothetical protein
MLNYDLARKRNLSPSIIVRIEQRQAYRQKLGEQYKARSISAEEYKEEWEDNEFILQELWGFPLDANYHMFWNMEGCICPRLDNRDSWGTMLHYYAVDCPLHGAING